MVHTLVFVNQQYHPPIVHVNFQLMILHIHLILDHFDDIFLNNQLSVNCIIELIKIIHINYKIKRNLKLTYFSNRIIIIVIIIIC